MLYHIVDKEKWSSAVKSGVYRPESVTSEGFIHCSDINKIIYVANAFYKGFRNLVLLHIDESKVNAEIKWEDLGGFNYEYPHIYGSLNLDAVVAVQDFAPDENGCYRSENILD